MTERLTDEQLAAIQARSERDETLPYTYAMLRATYQNDTAALLAEVDVLRQERDEAQAALKWHNESPTASARTMYWWRPSPKASGQVVEFLPLSSGALAAHFIGTEEYMFLSQLSGGQWAGPIAPPVEASE